MAVKTFEFDEERNPQQLGFYECREDIAGFTGGFGNGKTAVLGVVAITIASQYEKARVLVGRATRPKLEDSTKPELLKWLPEEWVESWPSERRNNVLLKHTGSTIEFRHIRQEGKGKGEEQSNLLSATYDAILVDQLDDPEFTYKDFADLIGRLRGTARYIGSDPTMPSVGPQWLRFGANPTRNWLYRELVGPYFTFKNSGLITQKMARYMTEDKHSLVAIYNAPSSANMHNTGEKYVQRMNMVMSGSLKKRYVDANWDAYEGLVYPDYHEAVHMVQHEQMLEYVQRMLKQDALGVVEGYDYGKSSPSCYGLAFYNDVGDIFLIDGFYEPQFSVRNQALAIKKIRNKYGIIPKDHIFADPDIFKGKNATATNVGESIAALFANEGIDMQRGANKIEAGIEKVSSYLAVDNMHRHPITGKFGAPRIFVSSELEWWHNEIVDYYWNKNVQGLNVDKPRDVNDHAMDMTKYLLTKRAKVVGAITRRMGLPKQVYMWGEQPDDPRGRILPRHM